MKKLPFYISCCLFFLVFSCQNESKPPADPNPTGGGIQPLENSQVRLICSPTNDPNQEPGYPQNEVFLYLAESKVKVADILACEKIDPNQYGDHQIPKNAIAAVGGWWAGSGDYVYIVEEDGNFVVKKGEIFEEQTDDSYHYETVMTFTKEGKEVF